jgi:Zn-dependent M16 (insulinase) family peptidase
MFTGRCLDRNLDKMFQLSGDILTDPHFENDQRLMTLVRMAYTDMGMCENNAPPVFPHLAP